MFQNVLYLNHCSVVRIDEKAVVLAFANMCAMFHTAPLNGKATCASALPIANSLWLGLLWGPHYKTKKR